MVTPSDTLSQTPESAHSRLRVVPAVVVFLGGINLFLIQWVLVRELTTLLFGTELVILLVTVSYFAGLSVGYGISHRIRRAWLLPLGTLMLLLHLTLPVWFRVLVSALDVWGGYGVAFVILPASVPFVISAFYSIFLPYFVDQGSGELPALYALELGGSAVGILVLVLLGGLGLQMVYSVYGVCLVLILALLGMRWLVLLPLSVVVGLWLLAFPAVNYWSNSLFFTQLYNLPAGTTTLFSGYSPYQKVDLLEAPNGARLLFLDGLEHFGSASGRWLNVVMGRVPASLTRPENALVFGAGSMQLELMIANFADHVTTVEIDPLVVAVSTDYLTAYNRMDVLENRTVIVDDAKHFIANDDATYDLIATDLPAAFTLQTAALYSQTFFAHVSDHLTPDGVFSVNLTSQFTPTDTISRRIVAGLLAEFEDVMVIHSDRAGWSFAYAGHDLPFAQGDVVAALEASGETGYAVFETDAARAIVGDARSITLDSLDIVLEISADRIRGNMGG